MKKYDNPKIEMIKLPLINTFATSGEAAKGGDLRSKNDGEGEGTIFPNTNP